MTEFFMGPGSYLGIMIFMILTGAGCPLPEEVAIIAAGVLASHGQLDPWLALGALLVGGVLGDCLMYYIGHHFGRSVVRKHRWWAHYVTAEREAIIEEKLKAHGVKVLFLSRFLVGVRSPVYLSAGILGFPFRRFLLIDLFCAATVIGIFFSLSYFFGKTITTWIREAEVLLTVVVVAVVAVVGIYCWRRHRRKAAEAEKVA